MKYKVTVEILSVEDQREYDSDAGPRPVWSDGVMAGITRHGSVPAPHRIKFSS
jgi:hypothetical protein